MYLAAIIINNTMFCTRSPVLNLVVIVTNLIEYRLVLKRIKAETVASDRVHRELTQHFRCNLLRVTATPLQATPDSLVSVLNAKLSKRLNRRLW